MKIATFVVVLVLALFESRCAWAAFPAGNPLSATIPTSSLSITLEDVVTIPNSSGQAPRLEFLTSGGAPGLAYVFDQRGKIYSFDPAIPAPTPSVFLDLSAAVPDFNVGAQTGVRGLAFHPDFHNAAAAGYRKFYTSHARNASAPLVGSPSPAVFPSPSTLHHHSVVGEWTMDANGTVNTSSYRELIRIGQPFADHGVGQIGFNPNAGSGDADFGNLYVTMGDGGNNFPPIPIDPHNHGQDLNNPHGSILRINPLGSGSDPYTIPSDNPFRVDSNPSTSRNTIWAYGLRNPHRFTFDRGGDHKMLITDIGQSNIEEVNLGAAGANYGWDLREGTFQTTGSFSGSNNLVDPLPANHATDAFTYPVAQYDHDWDNNSSIEGLWSIVGGSVYRGTNVPELQGKYIFGEFAQNSGAIFAVEVDDLVQREDFSNLQSLHNGHLAPFEQLNLVHDGAQKTLLQIIRDASGNQSLNRTDLRFGSGPDGDIYVLNKHDGRVRRIASAELHSQVVVDGTRAGDEAFYGAALSVQNTNTAFGNATNGDSRYANGGSEIDQVFGVVQGDRLYVLVTGNLESNFNKLEVFIDSAPGGVNQLNGSDLPTGVDPYCCGSNLNVAALQRMNGLRFDAGFEADHYLTFSNGNHTFGSPAITRWTLSAYYAELANGAAGDKSELGFQYRASGVEPELAQGTLIDQLNNGCTGPADTNCSPPEHEFAEPIDTINDPNNARNHRDFLNDIGLQMAINNSNTGGVNAGSGAATGNPQNVFTGIEFSLPLSQLGYPLGDIRIAAFINSGGHNFVSNQFAGVGVLRGNLGDNLPGINLATIAGNQFVTVPHVGLPGDYNDDGTVDAADYTVWRKFVGTANTLPNNPTPGPIDATEYNAWREHFGQSLAGSGQGNSVPEPTALAVTLLIVLSPIAERLRRPAQRPCNVTI